MKYFPLIETCLLTALAIVIPVSVAEADSAHYANRTEYRAPMAASDPLIDGVADETIWADAPWQELKFRWLDRNIRPKTSRVALKLSGHRTGSTFLENLSMMY